MVVGKVDIDLLAALVESSGLKKIDCLRTRGKKWNEVKWAPIPAAKIGT